MANDERYVSPYLLRPLRTFDQVFRGRSGAAEPDISFEGRQARSGRNAPRETADREHPPSHATRPTDRCWHTGHP
jgi:hypothetical protein